MKTAHLVILIVLSCALGVACGVEKPAAKPVVPKVNLALAFVHKVDADVPCEPFFTDVGEHHVHSVVCKLPTKQIVYCTVSDESWPSCKAIDGSDAKPAQEPGAPPPTKPIEPPAPPAAKTKGK